MADVKTETQIETDFYRIIKSSQIPSIINGKVYRRGMRPLDSQKEDCIVQFLSGQNGQLQEGVLNMNIFVPKILIGSNTNKVEDLKRVEELEIAIMELFTDKAFENPYYLVEVNETPQTIDYADIEQTCINTRIHYTRTTF